MGRRRRQNLHPPLHRDKPGGGVCAPTWSRLGLLIGLLLAPVAWALTVSVSPDELFVNEIGLLAISSNQSMPENAVLPKIDGLTWLGTPRTSQQTQIVNGRRSFVGTASYPFRIERTGPFRIAGVKVDEGGRKVEAPAVEVTVRERRLATDSGRQLTMNEALHAEITYAGGQGALPYVYVGQEIAVHVDIFAAEQLQARFGYPELTVDNAMVRDYSRENQNSAQFATATAATRRIVDGVRFQLVQFRSAILPLAVGEVSGEVRIPCEIVLPGQPRERAFFEGFFGGGRGVSRQITGQLPPLQVRRLPAVPEDAGFYLGLMGDWQSELQVSTPQARVGEPVTLTLKLAGQGSLHGLKAPKLDLPNYRCFDPEVRKNDHSRQSTAEITWAIIPLSKQANQPVLAVATFDPRRGGYVRREFKVDLEILPARPGVTPPGGAIYGAPGSGVAIGTAQPAGVSSLLYIKSRQGGEVEMPLWRNTAGLAMAGLAAGALAYLGLAGLGWWRTRLGGDPGRLRQRQARRRRGKVLAALRRAAPEQVVEVARREAIPYLAAVWEQPPGTTANELAKLVRLRDAELAGLLEAVEYGGFAPGGGTPVDGSKLAAAIRRLACLAFGLWLGWAAGPSAVAAQPAQAPTFEDAKAAYDRGDYQVALTIFGGLGRVDARNPVLLYNQGNCLYELGRQAEAIAIYEQARRLAPRDSDIGENLRFVRAQLSLPDPTAAQTPGQLLIRLRDLLRPDEWLLLTSLAVGGCLAWAGVRRFRGRPVGLPLLVAAGILAAGGAAIQAQRHSTYRPGAQAVVTSRQTVAYQHPSPEARKTDFIPTYGRLVAVREARSDWYLIRQDDAEGWVRQGELTLVW